MSHTVLTFIHIKSEQIYKNDTFTQVTLLQSGGHLYHGQQSLRYVGRLQDHGTNLSCTVVQLDHLGTVLYSSTISLQLEVSELVIYSQGSGVLEERIGIISGIILAVIFIILIFILTALLLTRRRKKVKTGIQALLYKFSPRCQSMSPSMGKRDLTRCWLQFGDLLAGEPM